jgi:hypothetical protein
VAKATYTKVQIACEYLDAAMDMYIQKRNYLCAIHLAAAAEELLGMHLPAEQRICTLAMKAQMALQILGANPEPGNDATWRVEHEKAKGIVLEPKNQIKHHDRGETDEVLIDPVFEAAHWIEQALINFEKLKLVKSAAYWRFIDYRNREMRQGIG